MSKSVRSLANAPSKTGWQLYNPAPPAKVYPFIIRRIKSERSTAQKRQNLLRQRKEAAKQLAVIEQTSATLTTLEVQLEQLKQQKQQIFTRLRSSLSKSSSSTSVSQSPQTPLVVNEMNSPAAKVGSRPLVTTPNPSPLTGQGNRPLALSFSAPPTRPPGTPLYASQTSGQLHNQLSSQEAAAMGSAQSTQQTPGSSASSLKPCALVRPTTKPPNVHDQMPGPNLQSPVPMHGSSHFPLPARFSSSSNSSTHAGRSSSNYTHGSSNNPRM